MINITINAESGAQARQELIDLLGEFSINTLKNDQKFSDTETVNAKAKKSTMIIVDDPLPNADQEKAEALVETATKKRRTKADIEAEKKVVEFNNAPVEEETIPEETTDTQTEEVALDVKVLQNKAVELGRVGKRELVKAVLAKFGAEAFTAQPKPLDPKHYAECLTELEKL